MLKQLVGAGQHQSFKGHTCQAWSVAPCIFEWRGTQRLGTGLDQQRRGLEREEEVWSEGRPVAQPLRPECLPGSHPLSPFQGLPLPLHVAFPARGQSSSFVMEAL